LLSRLGHVLTVNAEDDVALLQSHFRCRHILIGLIDAHASEFEVVADQRADTGILAREHHLHVLALVLGIVFGIGIQRVEHGVDAIAHHLVSVECVDIHHVEVAVDGVEHLKVLCHLEVVVSVGLCPTHGGEQQAGECQKRLSHIFFMSFSVYINVSRVQSYEKEPTKSSFSKKSCKNIWWFQGMSVPLQPQIRNDTHTASVAQLVRAPDC
jgi:hypothetical protein